jgi:TRAP-type C4-dicarboxylate transport system permease small subunit
MIILATIFTFVIIKASYELISFSYQLGTRSGSWLRIPVIWPQLVLIIGSILLLFQLIAEIMKAIKNRDAGGKT